VESLKIFEEFTGRRTIMEVMGAERRKVLDYYIAVAWTPNKKKLQRPHRIEVRSMEENTTAAAEHDHSSNKKFEDSVKPHHGITKTSLTLDKNSKREMGKINRNRLMRQNPMPFGKLARQWLVSPCLLKV
jgi:hypothetical protein